MCVSLCACVCACVSDAERWPQDVTWLESSHAVVADVTQPSLGVGYELGIAGLGVLGFGFWDLGFGIWVLGLEACGRLITLPFIRKAEETSLVSLPQ